ncbi:MAG: hypothetical protein KatS3mg049_2118 [Caldilinea sp.]|nr:MAG: hypothetical protein KatS3mg049_2118 [Caldilinea sp.]
MNCVEWVWKYARAAGAELLVLLALAEGADGDGVCCPDPAWLARRARVSVREVVRILDRLEQAGELEALPGSGRRYLICSGLSPARVAAIRARIDAGQATDGPDVQRAIRELADTLRLLLALDGRQQQAAGGGRESEARPNNVPAVPGRRGCHRWRSVRRHGRNVDTER